MLYHKNTVWSSKKMTFFSKKPFKINILLIFLFLFCSNCGKKPQNCVIFPKYKDFDSKKLETTKNFIKILKSGEAYAQIQCDF